MDKSDTTERKKKRYYPVLVINTSIINSDRQTS